VHARPAFARQPEFHVVQETHAIRHPLLPAKGAGEMSMVEIAENLERVTSLIEGERVKEREARKVYEAVARDVESNIAKIREFAKQLVAAHGSRLSTFSGMLGETIEVKPHANGPSTNGIGHVTHARRPAPHAIGDIKNLADAVLRVWDLEPTAMTSEDIADLLPRTGYQSNAAPASIRSSVNQAIAKLCRIGKVIRYRGDGSIIPIRDRTSRARKYLAASKAPESDVA
jgi:hypothetical protein